MQYTPLNKSLPTFYSQVNNDYDVFVSKPYPLATKPITALHYHNLAELGVCMQGEGETYIENKVFKFKKGSVQILPPNVSHLSKANSENCVWVWIHINAKKLFTNLGLTDPDGVLSLSSPDNFLSGVFFETDYPELTALVNKIILEWHNKDENSPLVFSSLVAQLLVECKRVKKTIKQVENPQPINTDNLNKVIDYISLNLDDNSLNEETLASIMKVSVSTLRRAFKKNAGINPKEFIIRSRMAYAEYLLRNTTLTVLDVSMRVGYNEISGFNRVFKAYFNLSPSKYRKTFKKA